MCARTHAGPRDVAQTHRPSVSTFWVLALRRCTPHSPRLRSLWWGHSSPLNPPLLYNVSRQQAQALPRFFTPLPEYCCGICGGLQGEGDWGIWYCSEPGGCRNPTEGLGGEKRGLVRTGEKHGSWQTAATPQASPVGSRGSYKPFPDQFAMQFLKSLISSNLIIYICTWSSFN